MYKNLTSIIMAGLLVLSTPVHAELTLTECPPEVGTLLTGATSGTYCVSKITMSWWSGFSWCQAIGGKFATWAETCPGVGIGGKCTNTKNATGWTSVADNCTFWRAEPDVNNITTRSWSLQKGGTPYSNPRYTSGPYNSGFPVICI